MRNLLIAVLLGIFSTITCAEVVMDDLSWSKPTTFTDGTAVTGLTGYRVYAAVDSPDLLLITDIPFSTQLTYTATFDLAPSATDYVISYQVTAYDATGLESPRSNLVQTIKSIPITNVISAPVLSITP